MRLWISRNSEVPLREQLTTQIVLGIISDDLKEGQRLPSTRAMARRFGIHANTVSAAYKDLSDRGWVEFRKGSGIYVRALSSDAASNPEFELDRLIAGFVQNVRSRGYSLQELRTHMRGWVDVRIPDRFVLIEPDVELRRILLAEIKEATGITATGIAPADLSVENSLEGSAVIALYNHSALLQDALPPNLPALFLHSRSVPASIAGKERPASDDIVAIASRSEVFLTQARTILVAAGIDPGALNLRDACTHGWKNGLGACAMIITDTLTARELQGEKNVRPFVIIADSSLVELREFMTRDDMRSDDDT